MFSQCCLLPTCHMSSSVARRLANRLAIACYAGDLPSAQAAVADGASVHESGKAPDGVPWLPLRAAVRNQRLEVVVWLLSLGADPNGDRVMYYCARFSTAAILQLLIDAGGDVNRTCSEEPPLFPAVRNIRSGGNVGVLLAQPSLDVTIMYVGKTPEQHARDEGKPAVADTIAQEVSGQGCLSCFRNNC